MQIKSGLKMKMHWVALLYLTKVQVKKQIIFSQVTIIQFK